MIIVTGCGGTIGRYLVPGLRAIGVEFRQAFHSETKIRLAKTQGNAAIRIDFDRPDTLLHAFAGATTLFLRAANGERQLQQELNAVAAARQAGITTIVKLSAWRAPQQEFAFARLHREVESAIEAAGMAWVFLQPSGFMQNFTNFMGPAIRESNAFHLPAAAAKVSHVDARDVADVAVRVLTTPGHAGRSYALSGPRALSYDEAASVLSDRLGRAIRYVPRTEAEACQAMLDAGAPSSYAADVADLFRAYRAGVGAYVASGVQDILGRLPGSFEQFVHNHAHCFRPGEPTMIASA